MSGAEIKIVSSSTDGKFDLVFNSGFVAQRKDHVECSMGLVAMMRGFEAMGWIKTFDESIPCSVRVVRYVREGDVW